MGGDGMAQYCRYCSNLVVGDIAYCQIRKKEIREALAKTTNYCPAFDLNPIDAFGENENGYQPRAKRMGNEQLEGQMSISDWMGV